MARNEYPPQPYLGAQPQEGFSVNPDFLPLEPPAGQTVAQEQPFAYDPDRGYRSPNPDPSPVANFGSTASRPFVEGWNTLRDRSLPFPSRVLGGVAAIGAGINNLANVGPSALREFAREVREDPDLSRRQQVFGSIGARVLAGMIGAPESPLERRVTFAIANRINRFGRGMAAAPPHHTRYPRRIVR